MALEARKASRGEFEVADLERAAHERVAGDALPGHPAGRARLVLVGARLDAVPAKPGRIEDALHLADGSHPRSGERDDLAVPVERAQREQVTAGLRVHAAPHLERSAVGAERE